MSDVILKIWYIYELNTEETIRSLIEYSGIEFDNYIFRQNKTQRKGALYLVIVLKLHLNSSIYSYEYVWQSSNIWLYKYMSKYFPKRFQSQLYFKGYIITVVLQSRLIEVPRDSVRMIGAAQVTRLSLLPSWCFLHKICVIFCK